MPSHQRLIITSPIKLSVIFVVVMGASACEEPRDDARAAVITETPIKPPEREITPDREVVERADVGIPDAISPPPVYEDMTLSNDMRPVDMSPVDMSPVDMSPVDMSPVDMRAPDSLGVSIRVSSERRVRDRVFLEVTPATAPRLSDEVCRIDRPTELCEVTSFRHREQVIDLTESPPDVYLISVLLTDEIEDDEASLHMEVSCGGEFVANFELSEVEVDDVTIWDALEIHLPSCEVTTINTLSSAQCNSLDECLCPDCHTARCSPEACSPLALCDVEMGCDVSCGDQSCAGSERCDASSLSCTADQCNLCNTSDDCATGFACLADPTGQGHCHMRCQEDDECGDLERCVTKMSPYINSFSFPQSYCLNELLFCDAAECVADSDCGELPYCAQGRCVSCLNDSYCPLGRGICTSEGSCVECVNDQDCLTGLQCEESQCMIPGADRQISEWSDSSSPDCLTGMGECTEDEVCNRALFNGECVLPCHNQLLCPQGSTCCEARCYPDEYIPAACLADTPPVAVSTAAVYHASDRLLGVSLTGSDQAVGGADVIGGEVSLRDADDVEVFGESASLPFSVTLDSADPSLFTIMYADTWPPDVEVPTSILIRAFDSRGLRTDWVRALVEPPVALGLGDDCDPIFNTCPEQSACVNTCIANDRIPFVCPEGWSVSTLMVDTPAMGDLRTATTMGSSTCGGGGPSDIYHFIPPQAGTYHFIVRGEDIPEEDSDPLIYVRARCGDNAPQFELACNDDYESLDSGLEVTLAAQEEVYLFVDSFGGRSLTPYTLTVRLGALP